VLFVASWYPSDANPVAGIFIQRHALAASEVAEVAVVHVEGRDGLDRTCDVRVAGEDGLVVVRGAYRRSGRGLKWTRPVLYLQTLERCLRAVRHEFGTWDILHINVALPAGVAAFLPSAGARGREAPVVLTEHWTGYSPLCPEFDSLPALKKVFVRKVFQRARCITTVSRALGKALVRRGLCKTYQVLPNVVSREAFDSFGPGNMDNVEYNVGKKKLIHVSLLNDSKKNVSGILRAAAQLARTRDDFELYIVGDGPDRSRLEAYAEELGLNGVAVFTGRVMPPRLYGLMRSSTAHLIFSRVETFSVVTAEALACGVPVIVTRCGGPEEFVDEQSGVIIEPGNETALVRAMTHMLDHGAEYDRQHIHERAWSLFSPSVVTKMIAEIYHSMLK
jgi:glycosyltransferase involved in cell wall biosynthesis